MKPVLNAHLKIEKITLDECHCDVYVVDDFLENPEEVQAFAQKSAYFNPIGKDGTLYPGIRDALPLPYHRVLSALLTTLFEGVEPQIHRCMLSLITQQPEQLLSVQKMPHIDSTDNQEYASVHYLCGPHMGGTSIYRFKPANRVRFDQDSQDEIMAMVNMVESQQQDPDGYLNGSNQLFEQVLNIEAKFNRLVLYPSNILHSANVHPHSISANPSNGRLTVASFFRLTPNS
ncbi:hypothetical protein CWB99_09630 [Pseudoalteromonas rubra]|uniref:Prolyl 4-hydroxylase alpha subunit Fe(2+) 2OG dioxygenase domain-containing protein n=1 Tax=Pseudoalteromonas rubra TaxID=43658 RepID=A0A5S3WNL3_9GAMM|nr:DUF6445 family protein [Pseudoalteromonas rubra]TMP29021.1 hypothetical protein CWB99_09630 [Pseudoalteromonas rubra]TMP29179.1 hypothetical protein CWC00_19745 [Pseudoalteromonas rubra]